MKLTLSLLSLFLLVSCGKKSPLIFSDRGLTALKNKPFEDMKNKVLIPHCISCHKKATTEEGIAHWVKAGKPESSALYMAVKEGRMPKKAAPLSTVELELIFDYITSSKQ